MAKIFVPVTPGGTAVHWLKSNTEAEAWTKLLEDAKHMPYRGKAEFQERGYSVKEMTEGELKAKAWFPQAMSKPR